MASQPISFKAGKTLDGSGESEASAPAGASDSPSLSISHNSIECDKEKPKWQGLTGSQKRTAEALRHNIEDLAGKFGIERLLFVTLTFGDHVTDISEAQRRFNSLATNQLKKRYLRVIAVLERMEGKGRGHGRIHFHCLCVAQNDVKTGCNFDAIASGDYRSANANLRSEWAYWRETAPRYKFGRTESLPVKSSSAAISKYVGSYISKHIGKREFMDKGAKAIRYIGYPKLQKPPWNSHHMRVFDDEGKETDSWLWRKKLKEFCRKHNTNEEGMKRVFGPRWAFNHQKAIAETRITECYPSKEMMAKDVQPFLSEAKKEASLYAYKKNRELEDYARRVWSACDTLDYSNLPDYVDEVPERLEIDRFKMAEHWRRFRGDFVGNRQPFKTWADYSLPSD